MFNLIDINELSNNTLFDNIRLSDKLNKETVVNTIFEECGEFEPISFDVDVYKKNIKTFFMRHYEQFDRMVKALIIEYEPLENYDKRSEITTDYKHDGVTNDNGTVNETVTTDVSAFDSNTFQPSSKDTSANSTQNSKHDDVKDTTKVIERTHGNIGVTTSTQMLENEFNIRMKLDIYKSITDLFCKELMIPVW